MNKKEQKQDILLKLLTPDGVGRRKKAEILLEYCETQNHNLTREKLRKLLKNKHFN